MPVNTTRTIVSLWATLVLLAACQLLFNTSYQSDMGAFMPAQGSAPLSQSLKEGPAARIWLIAVSGGSRSELAQVSKLLTQQLRGSGDFSRVLNGEAEADSKAQQLLNRYRYLLDDRVDADYFSSGALHSALNQRLDELRSPLSAFTKQWLTSDPTAALFYLSQQQQRGEGALQREEGAWIGRDGEHALIMAESREAGFDLDLQQQVRARITAAFAALNSNRQYSLILSGAPQIALQTRDTIRSDAQRLSIVATVFMVLFLAWVYRSAKRVLFTALPLLGGIIVAAATVSLWFGNLHAITVAFGITVLGVAVDYPIHLLSHRRADESATTTMARIWPTLRLGVVSTLLAYLAMALTDFTGLAQLGLFSIAGLLTAALITRTLLPRLDSNTLQQPFQMRLLCAAFDRKPEKRLLVFGAAMPLLALALVLQQPQLWSDDIAQLNPVPQQQRDLERTLRSQLGTAENRYMIIVEAASQELLLQRQEQLTPLLDVAVSVGEIGHYQQTSQLLPSQQLQQQRQASLPDSVTLRAALAQASEGLPFRVGSFAPFVAEVEASRTLTLLSADQLKAAGLSLFLFTDERGASAIIRLVAVSEPQALQRRVAGAGITGLHFVDLKQASSDAVGRFRTEALQRVLWASGLILLALWLGMRHLPRLLRVVAPVAAAVVVAMAVPLLLGASLNIFNLVSLLLVAGIGLDYALFFSRPDEDGDRQATLHSLLVCAVSTASLFAILATSAVPVLHSIGITVAVGIVSAFCLSWIFSRSTQSE